jgi:hypothetical protein
MKGSVFMDYRTAPQSAVLCDLFDKEIERLNSLPKEQAKKETHDFLFEAGIVDKDDNFTEPYAALGERYARQENDAPV